MRTAVIILEGGPLPRNELQETITGLRHAVTLDTVEKFAGVAGVDQVVLATNHAPLAGAAQRLGAAIHDTRTRGLFHFGRSLQRAVAETGADRIIYLGGAALPLITDEEIAWILGALASDSPCVVVNNPQSADLVAWSPTEALTRIEPPLNDNFLGWYLREAGLKRVLIPNSASVHFDLDTPTDYLMMALSGRVGRRSAAALRALDWDKSRLNAACDLLAADLPEIGLLGRVGTAVVEHINTHLRCRLRVFSEERGMKALGREEAGLVTSFMAEQVDELGPKRFFGKLGQICSAIFFDTRVVFASKGRRVSEWDRFHSDLGQTAQIRDPWVRAFTEAALACPVPVVLGGHSAVAGGLWLLADVAIQRRGGAGRSQLRGFAP